MNKEQQIEQLVSDLRSRVRMAGLKGDKDLLKAYTENLAAILNMRDAMAVIAEEEMKGIA